MVSSAQSSQVIPNLIQGVSQQAPAQRRDSQCEAQYDCLNYAKDGCYARPGAIIGATLGGDYSGSFCYEFRRGDSEHYLATIKNGDIRVLNLTTGEGCVVNVIGSAGNYLGNVGEARNAFVAQTVNDYTFLGNKQVLPQMRAGVLSPTRPKEAMLFVKAGAYAATYKVSIRYNNQTYTYAYQTPDNSNTTNAIYIDTSQIAATLYRAMTNVPATPGVDTVGGVYSGDPGGSGAGLASTVVTVGGDLVALGFTVEINGSILRISRPDGVDFAVDVSDSVGNTYFLAFKDTARSFDDLPRSGFLGMLLKVQGVAKDNEDDYYVQYQASGSAAGYWGEVIAPGLPIQLDPESMPHALINTGLNTFDFKANVWGSRIAGDDNTAKVPSFIGKAIQNLAYDHKRLVIMSEGSAIWSKTSNTFVYFVDTVQTVLATAPIDIDIGAPNTIALLRASVSIDEGFFLWAQLAQFRVNSGNDPFRQDTIEAPLSTAYEFTETCNLATLGSAVYFGTEPSKYANIFSLPYANGRPAGETDITAHVSSYIPKGLRNISPSATLRTLMVRTDGDPSSLYCYNFLTSGRDIVQSAWNKWRMPLGTIVWSSIYKSQLLMLLARPVGNTLLLSVSLDPDGVDDDADAAYQTRLDLRVTEAAVSGMAFDIHSNSTLIPVPYPLATEEFQYLRVVCRETNGKATRGKVFELTGETDGSSYVKVHGDATGVSLYVGLRVDSRRQESEFFLRTQGGVVPTDRLTMREFRVTFDGTVYTRLEVDQGRGRRKQSVFNGVSFSGQAQQLGTTPAGSNGTLSVSVDSLPEELGPSGICIVNDSPFPSKWQTAEYIYEAIKRAQGGTAQADKGG